MAETLKVDEINDIMTTFLDNLVEVAKIHTEYKEKLGEDHEYTKLAHSLVRIFNQYQSIYVYISDQEAYANELVLISGAALEVLAFKPYELLDGNSFKRKKQLKADKKNREAKLKELNCLIERINEHINKDMPKEDSLEE